MNCEYKCEDEGLDLEKAKLFGQLLVIFGQTIISVGDILLERQEKTRRSSKSTFLGEDLPYHLGEL